MYQNSLFPQYTSPLGSSYTINPPTLQMPQPLPTLPSVRGPQLDTVNGIESVKQYPTVANARYALFDLNDDVFYIKETDSSNFPTIRRFRFYEENEQKKEDAPQYVTMEEFEKFKMEVMDAQQSVRKQSSESGNWKNHKSDNGKSTDNGKG